jgi:membrane protease YdiL (CAAX protease family)
MGSSFKFNKTRLFIILEVFLALLGLGVFAWFIHGEKYLFIIAVGSLLLAGMIISFSVLHSEGIYLITGSDWLNKRAIIFSLFGFITGIGLAGLYRIRIGLSFFPVTLTTVAIISPLIGITEELIFRGYIQGRMKVFGIFISIFVAAAGHALYKYLVLKSLQMDIGTDFVWMILVTFTMGLILGAAREYSGSVMPAVVWHATFDIIFYGDFQNIPVWVWS